MGGLVWDVFLVEISCVTWGLRTSRQHTLCLLPFKAKPNQLERNSNDSYFRAD